MSVPEQPAAVTRIALRRAIPGHAGRYEAELREMFTSMRRHEGFLGGEIIPPQRQGGFHQVIVKFRSEADLAAWDGSADRRHHLARMRDHAEGDPQHRRLDILQEWFVGPAVPAAARPARWRTAIVTWMAIWPLVSLSSYFLAPELTALGLPFLLVSAVNVVLIVTLMTYLVAPVLTRLMRWFLVPARR